ncbi:uncharacterized protein TNCV_1274581 [Trichonephila clavipes]|nr:uncharacterized protein TNCV_1274581 [Trichonephila clavipes]
MKNEEPIHIPDFNFVASYKRPEVPAAGVAIYQHTQDTSHIVTSYMDIHTKFTRGIGVNVSDIGEICVARCNSENGQYILMVAVYISPEKSMQQIEQFLFENLMIYTKEGSELLEKKRFCEKFDDIPMILSGDFNINFADDKNLSLIEFLNETLGLTMSNDRKVSTTKFYAVRCQLGVRKTVPYSSADDDSSNIGLFSPMLMGTMSPSTERRSFHPTIALQI